MQCVGKHCLALPVMSTFASFRRRWRRMFFESSLQASMQLRGDIAAEVLTQCLPLGSMDYLVVAVGGEEGRKRAGGK